MDRQAYYNLGFLTSLLAMTGLFYLQRGELRQLRAGIARASAAAAAVPQSDTPMSASQNHPAVRNPALGPPTPESGTANDAPPGYAQQLASLQQQVAQLQEPAAPRAETPGGVRHGLRTLPPQDSLILPLPDNTSPLSSATLKGPTWNHAQATGEPDTPGAGDLPTAWAPKRPQSGEQWLQLGYDSPVEIGTINVLETHHPGALSRVTALMPDGSEREIWRGTTPAGEAPVETSVPVPPGITSNQIRLYVDTNRVQSWPEIDAVELVGADGSRQWASSSSASSSYHEAETAAAPVLER